MQPLAAAQEFAPYFSSREIAADDEPMQCALQRLRFDVYCVECKFLPVQDYPDARETDLWDARSSHFGASNGAGALVGCLRLVRPDEAGRLPYQAHCGELRSDIELPPPQASGEISRLMVRADYRRRSGDLLAGMNVAPPVPGALPDERRNPSPQILLSLYRCLYARSVADGVRWWYAAMERPLARALRGMGFVFEQIGPQTDYYGPVAPYLADLRALEAGLEERNPALMRWLQAIPPGTVR